MQPFRVALAVMLITPACLLIRSLDSGEVGEDNREDAPLQLLRAGNAALVRNLQARAAAAAAEGARLAQMAQASRAGLDKLPDGEAAELKQRLHGIRDDIAEVARAQAAVVAGMGGGAVLEGGVAPPPSRAVAGAAGLREGASRLVDYAGLGMCGTECKDRRGECGAWGGEGRCTTAHQYMSVMCSLTCGSCQSCRRTVPATEEGVARAIIRREGYWGK